MDRNALLWVGNEDFEDMEAFVVDHTAVVFEEVHGEFKVVARLDVSVHEDEIGTLKEETR